MRNLEFLLLFNIIFIVMLIMHLLIFKLSTFPSIIYYSRLLHALVNVIQYLFNFILLDMNLNIQAFSLSPITKAVTISNTINKSSKRT
jgi:hypothetical protein